MLNLSLTIDLRTTCKGILCMLDVILVSTFVDAERHSTAENERATAFRRIHISVVTLLGISQRTEEGYQGKSGSFKDAILQWRPAQLFHPFHNTRNNCNKSSQSFTFSVRNTTSSLKNTVTVLSTIDRYYDNGNVYQWNCSRTSECCIWWTREGGIGCPTQTSFTTAA